MDEYPHKMYAGHVSVYEHILNNNGSLFYWLLESQRDPANDPLIIWLNGIFKISLFCRSFAVLCLFQGGPGCSSMVI